MDKVIQEKIEMLLCSNLYDILEACHDNTGLAKDVLMTMLGRELPLLQSERAKNIIKQKGFLGRELPDFINDRREATAEEKAYLLSLIDIYLENPLNLSGLVNFFELIESQKEIKSLPGFAKIFDSARDVIPDYFDKDKIHDHKLTTQKSVHTAQLNIVALSGKRYLLDVDLNENVYKTKQRFFSKQDFPPPYQRLIFHGKTLEDTQTLADCGIQGDSTLHFVPRLRGD